MKKNYLQFEDVYKYKVKKSNYLCLAAVFDYSLYEYELSNYIISLIKPAKSAANGELIYQLDYEVDFDEFCRKNATSTGGGRSYDYIKKALKGLMSKVVNVQMPNKAITGVHLLDRYEYKEGSGIGHVRIDDRLIPALFACKEYVLYTDAYSYHFTSKYSGRVCDMLRAFIGKENWKQMKDLKQKVNYHGDFTKMTKEEKNKYTKGYKKIKESSYTIKMSLGDFATIINLPKSIKGPQMIKRRCLDNVVEDINKSSEIEIKSYMCDENGVEFKVSYKTDTLLNQTKKEIEKLINETR